MRHQPFSVSNLSNGAYIESLYRAYREDEHAVDPSWRAFFAGVDYGSDRLVEALPANEGGGDLSSYLLIQAYRAFGHLAASINPLMLEKPPLPPELNLANFGLSTADLDKELATHGFLKERRAPLGRILSQLEAVYCGSVGFDYMALAFPDLEKFIQSRIEPQFHHPLSPEEKIALLHHLNRSEGFESFLHLKYPGQKRFSIEGGESMIPLLWRILEGSADLGYERAVIGMAHRGRLNVLTNVMGKSYAMIFQEFESHYLPESVEGSGDVKYHKGYASKLNFKGRSFDLLLAANPSHLEAVDPVVLGMARAFQEMGKEGDQKRTLPILIHGDAAVAGQGIVYECLQMSRIAGYTNQGTLHIVINNQIGFTALPHESRSTPYCTDIAKGFKAPVFHVNGEDPEACIMVSRLALEVRDRFGIDVFIDLNCYRKYGHNEADEPAFTQPKIYEIIRSKKNVRDLYIDRLISEGILRAQDIEAIQKEFRDCLEGAHSQVKNGNGHEVASPVKASPRSLTPQPITAKRLQSLAEKFCHFPETFNSHPKLKRLYEQRLQMVQEMNVKSIDWGMAEMLAYASLLTENIHVRLSGQDSQRGTFTHRHAVLVDQTTQAKYAPLNQLGVDQASFTALNSLLSEYGVMGFEFGYSMIYEKALVIWEAQFGDFANGAQIVIDQFLASAEQKWGKSSRLTLFLPHGYEGQGPEHSSARIERFLQLAGNDCYTVCNLTHPAQLFHLLRHQAYRSENRPLVVFMPKALLRYTPSLSTLSDFTDRGFEPIIDDPTHPKNATRLLLCSGKVYYDLLLEREKRQLQDQIAILRVEQIYPFDYKKLKAILERYPSATNYMWVQEEHENMGAWEFIRSQLLDPLGSKLRCAARPRAASPAAGSNALHLAQHQKLMKDVFYEG